MAKQPCRCGRQKAKGLNRCIECWEAAQPVTEREPLAQARVVALPEQFRVSRIPADQWPPGRRWCAGCQTFVRLVDCGKNATRCKTCSSVTAHAYRVRSVYGISPEDYRALFVAQQGRCYICQRLPRSKRLAVDHDHMTGEVRGLLCADDERGCNHAILGNIRDLAMAKRIVAYLEHPPAERILR